MALPPLQANGQHTPRLGQRLGPKAMLDFDTVNWHLKDRVDENGQLMKRHGEDLVKDAKEKEGNDDDDEELSEALKEQALKFATDPGYKKMDTTTKGTNASAKQQKEQEDRTKQETLHKDEDRRPSKTGIGAGSHSLATAMPPVAYSAPRRDLHDDFGRVLQRAPGDVTSRGEWQETLGHSIKRLFLDFELSEEAPRCRLNHLERMHSWFTSHASKQSRNSGLPPNYITTSRYGPPPPGSTRAFSLSMSNASRALATAFPDIGSQRSPRGVL